MAKFRILHTESSFGLGGQELRIASEAKGMMSRGHYVIIAAPRQSALHRLALEEGIPCAALPMGFRGWLWLVPLFLQLIARQGIQFVHTHGSQDSWTAAIAGRLSSRRPVIIRARHKSTPISPSFRHEVLYRHLPHAIVTTGEYIRRQLVSQHGVNPARVFSIPTGVDLSRFQPSLSEESLKETFGFEGKQLLLGTVTFLRREKGTHILIDAMGLLRNEFPLLRCLIIGSGPEQGKLLQQTREHHLESVVTFAGFMQNIPDLLNLLDVFVLPSLEEGMPQSLTQALAMECPVVASDVGSVSEVVVDQQTGLLVPPGNPRILSEKIAYLLREPGQGKRMGQAGRKRVESSFSLGEMVNKTERVYSMLWETKGQPPS